MIGDVLKIAMMGAASIVIAITTKAMVKKTVMTRLSCLARENPGDRMGLRVAVSPMVGASLNAETLYIDMLLSQYDNYMPLDIVRRTPGNTAA